MLCLGPALAYAHHDQRWTHKNNLIRRMPEPLGNNNLIVSRPGYLHANRGFRGRGEVDCRAETAAPADIGLTAEQRFLFALQGFLRLEGALSPGELQAAR